MQLEDPTACALFLDLDGTLIDIAPMPDGVTIPDGLVALLDKLTQGLDGALAIVTGRPIADIDRFLAPLAPVVAGVHGAEFRTARNGEIEHTAEPIADAVVDAVKKLAKAQAGITVEIKRASIAVHYRLAPAAEPRIEAALRRIIEARPDHLILCRGRKVLEIVPRHISKGAALETLLSLPAFRGRRPIMIGDDVTDLSAFAAATRLGGVGFKVAGELFSPAEADFAGPAAVRGWLAAMAERITRS